MNRLIALIVFAALAMSTAALAADTSRLGIGIGPVGSTPPSSPPDTPTDVLIASSTNGGVFTNLAPYYTTAIQGLGFTVTNIEDPDLGPFPFPAVFTSTEYCVVVVLTNDNWWGVNGNGQPEANVSLQDENRLAAYMDTGGKMLFSGQDYLWGRGNGNGFPQIYLGIANYTDDVYANGTNVNYAGVAGGAMAGLNGSVVASVGGVPCFNANAFYTDTIVPFSAGLMNWNAPTGESGQGGTSWDTGLYKTVFSGVELACTTNTTQFNRDVRSIFTWLGSCGTTSVEPSTWGAVKDMFSR